MALIPYRPFAGTEQAEAEAALKVLYDRFIAAGVVPPRCPQFAGPIAGGWAKTYKLVGDDGATIVAVETVRQRCDVIITGTGTDKVDDGRSGHYYRDGKLIAASSYTTVQKPAPADQIPPPWTAEKTMFEFMLLPARDKVTIDSVSENPPLFDVAEKPDDFPEQPPASETTVIEFCSGVWIVPARWIEPVTAADSEIVAWDIHRPDRPTVRVPPSAIDIHTFHSVAASSRSDESILVCVDLSQEPLDGFIDGVVPKGDTPSLTAEQRVILRKQLREQFYAEQAERITDQSRAARALPPADPESWRDRPPLL